jgi:hypothetical protein
VSRNQRILWSVERQNHNSARRKRHCQSECWNDLTNALRIAWPISSGPIDSVSSFLSSACWVLSNVL